MKKTIVVALLLLCAACLWAQNQEYTLQDAVQLLENDFERYPWAHLQRNYKIRDNRAESVKVLRQTYNQGEIVTMEIIKGGWRYEVKLDFTAEKQIHAKRSHDVKEAVYQSINEILPRRDTVNTANAGE